MLEKHKEWNSSRLWLTYTEVGTWLHKLRQQGIDFYCGKNGILIGSNLTQRFFDCSTLLMQPEHKIIDVDDEEA